MKLYVHIESLVVDGMAFGRNDERAFEGALRETLSPLLAGRAGLTVWSPARSGEIDSTPLQFAARPDAGDMGVAAAHSISGGLRE